MSLIVDTGVDETGHERATVAIDDRRTRSRGDGRRSDRGDLVAAYDDRGRDRQPGRSAVEHAHVAEQHFLGRGLRRESRKERDEREHGHERPCTAESVSITHEAISSQRPTQVREADSLPIHADPTIIDPHARDEERP
jgi:hypothetical protein